MKLPLLILLTVCALSLVACPGLPTATPWPEQQPTETPFPSFQEAGAAPHTITQRQGRPTATEEPRLSLQQYAANNAGGPGAIYVGDLTMLVGPALLWEHGDHDGNVPLTALEKYRFVFESDYYQDVLHRARVTDPTPMTSQPDAPIFILHACVNRAFMWCQLMESYFAPNLERRTGGMLTIEISSLPVLGVARSDTLPLLKDSTLDMANTYVPSTGGELPELAILLLYGLYSDHSQYFQAAVEMLPDVEQLLAEATGGYPIGVNWLSGHSPYLVGQTPLDLPEYYEGLRTYSYSLPLADWLSGMRSEPLYMSHAEVYTALERRILDAAAAPADSTHWQRWYEVTRYISGPLVSWPPSHFVVSRETWESLPADLQQIMKEEAARLELEALRLAPIRNEYGLQRLHEDLGMTYVEFSPEVQAQSQWAAMNYVVPGWVERIGGPDSPFVEVFNRVHGPLLGLSIEADGSVEKFR